MTLFPAAWAQSSAPETSAAPSTAKQATQPQASNPGTQTDAASSQPAAKPGSETGNSSPADDATADTKNPPSSSDDTAPTIRTTVNEVNVVFTVLDKHGHYVKGLQKQDFKVLDDKRPAPRISSFHTESDLPLQVGLLVDASNSVRDRFKFEQESAIEFLNQTLRPRYDKAFVVGFDSTPEVTQDFTDDTEALSRGVHMLRPGGGTAMFDALYFACRDKLLKERKMQTGPVRRAIILLSDGDDNQSHVTREEAIEMAQRSEVIVYTISTNITGSRNVGDKVLERIADATGGRAFFPFQLNDVANAFAEIQEELRSQYAISYRPPDFKADGHFHTIEILAANHKGLKVRARRGYYAPSGQ